MADSNNDPDFKPNQPSDPADVVIVPSSSDSPVPLRRSTRKRKTKITGTLQNEVENLLTDSQADDYPDRLEQFEYYTPADLGLPPDDPMSRVRIRVHPVAAMLMSLHSHLTRTEVIGYLGGTVYTPSDAPTETHIVITEAFSARAVSEGDLAETGRSAFREVEIDPESSVEVTSRIVAKGLEVVGWYHSHPDKKFTVEPSRVDIENQDNYQKHLFKDRLFVAAIIAPYTKDLPDFSPALEFFHVHNGEIPLRLPHYVDTLCTIPHSALPEYWPQGCSSQRRFPLIELEQECFELIDEYKRSTKRVRLTQRWRNAYTCIDKLRGALAGILDTCDLSGSVSNDETSNGLEETEKDRFLTCVDKVVDHAEVSFSTVAQEEAERRATRRRAKRSRNR